MEHLQKRPMLTQECTTEDLMEYNEAAKECVLAPNDTAHKLWSCHKLLGNLCLAFPQCGPDLPFLGKPAMRTRWMAGAAPHKRG